jgi:hypothetical protein
MTEKWQRKRGGTVEKRQGQTTPACTASKDEEINALPRSITDPDKTNEKKKTLK